MPNPWTITVTRTGNTLHYSSGGPAPKKQHVDPGHKVSWTSPDGHLIIFFKAGESPFATKKQILCAEMGKSTPAPHTIRHLLVSERPAVEFTYAVAHIDANDVMVIEDPDLIIDDPGGGPAGPPKAPKKKPALKIVKSPGK